MTQIKQDRGIFHVEKYGEKPGEKFPEMELIDYLMFNQPAPTRGQGERDGNRNDLWKLR